MPSTLTRSLIAIATVLGGIVAGFSMNRAVVDMPAWRTLGPDAWAQFTRSADLRRGLVVYPAEGIAALIATIAAAIAFWFDARAPRTGSLPVYAAAVTAIVAFILTRFALSPVTLVLRDSGVDARDLANALRRVDLFWRYKAALHVLTFVCNVWGLVIMRGG